jgi:hypothetical protein
VYINRASFSHPIHHDFRLCQHLEDPGTPGPHSVHPRPDRHHPPGRAHHAARRGRHGDQGLAGRLQKQDPTSPTGGFTALLTVFSGGGLQQAGIFALGIMPYISASIMVQLMTAVVPKLSRLGA